eukprot:NODE_994_length_1103_cov_260.309298_g690_i0.p1 GENE.NODE_994_length_1103_cov_260.309298_g690_i0~~NODE_994_length_1103_cov_260.309298_g690_i0.p1  ORF type:complete len:323 (-),score=49.74 NODE_994_length_1103_cov_260.309298_g690_i0:47-1015(-)
MAIYTDSISRQYFAASGGSTLLDLVGKLLVLIVPFVVAYFTGHFWVKEGRWREQPRVSWPNKAVLVVRGQPTGTDGEEGFGPVDEFSALGTTFVWTSLPKANTFLDSLLVVPHFEVQQRDADGDSKTDALDLLLQVPTFQQFEVHSIELLLLLTYELSDLVPLEMETPCYIAYSSATSGSAFTVEGDLAFRQRNLMYWPTTKYKYSHFTPATVHSIEDILLPTLLSKYAARNESTYLQVHSQYWHPATPNAAYFELRATIRIGATWYAYLPGPFEALKFAWVQFFVLAYVVSWLVWALKGILVKNAVVKVRCVDELKPKYRW